MSKRAEILRTRLDQLCSEDQISELRVNKLRNRMQDEQKLILEKYFGTTYDGFKMTIGRERVSITNTDSNWGVVDFYLHSNWKTDEGEKYDKIEMSTGSFRSEKMDESVVERFNMLSYFSKLVVDFEDDIIAEFNTNSRKYNKLIETFSDSRRALKKSIRSQEDDIRKIESEARLEKLFQEDGITINTLEDDNYLPQLQLKYNWRLSSVCKLKGIRKSASGKSVDLEITTRFKNWDSDKFTYRTQNADRIRVDNVESFLRANSNRIA